VNGPLGRGTEQMINPGNSDKFIVLLVFLLTENGAADVVMVEPSRYLKPFHFKAYIIFNLKLHNNCKFQIVGHNEDLVGWVVM